MWRVLLLLLLLLLLLTRPIASFVVPAGGADGLNRLKLLWPEAGELVKSPVTFLIEASTDDAATLLAHYKDKWMCVQVDESETKCVPVAGAEHLEVSLSRGPHSCVAFVADTQVITLQTQRQHITSAVSFTVLEKREFTEYEQQQIASIKTERLAEWASAPIQPRLAGSFNGTSAPSEKENSQLEPLYMVVGVKTRLIEGFPFRQAIRQTWASTEALPSDVRVLFIGCQAFQPVQPDESQALKLEKEVYGDFLMDELDCRDGYDQLPEKVKHFMHFVASTAMYRTSKYVMITDDDVYLRVPVLAAELRQQGSLKNIYAGASLSKPFIRPDRDPTSRNYLPESIYPMDELPPFALGPHYLLSMDCVEFIADNKDDLRGLGSLDDVSVALWMLTIQVHPQHIDYFRSLFSSSCRNELISFADLSPVGMAAIHSNLRGGRHFCYGMNRILWSKDAVKKSFKT